MESLEPKKSAIIRILQILWEYSDENHPLKHEQIIVLLDKQYGITAERKLIGRNIQALRDMEFEIKTSKRGSFLVSRIFEDSELRMLIDCVLSCNHISSKYSKELIDKLCSLSNKYFARHVKNIFSVNDWNKTDNKLVFYTIDIVDEAIENGKQISFDYNKYAADMKMHKSATHTVSPYQMILHNQRYYLMANNEKYNHITYYRMDRITNITLIDKSATQLTSISGYETGINYRNFSSSMPYMFSDVPEYVEFFADAAIIDQVIDWFGKDIKIAERDGKYLVGVSVSPNAMEYWALQYAKAVEIVSPEFLREKVLNSLRNAYEKYNNKKSESN